MGLSILACQLFVLVHLNDTFNVPAFNKMKSKLFNQRRDSMKPRNIMENEIIKL